MDTASAAPVGSYLARACRLVEEHAELFRAAPRREPQPSLRVLDPPPVARAVRRPRQLTLPLRPTMRR